MRFFGSAPGGGAFININIKTLIHWRVTKFFICGSPYFAINLNDGQYIYYQYL